MARGKASTLRDLVLLTERRGGHSGFHTALLTGDRGLDSLQRECTWEFWEECSPSLRGVDKHLCLGIRTPASNLQLSILGLQLWASVRAPEELLSSAQHPGSFLRALLEAWEGGV